jgi:hypothetical protein
MSCGDVGLDLFVRREREERDRVGDGQRIRKMG